MTHTTSVTPRAPELLSALGQPCEALLVDERPLALTNNRAEQQLQRLNWGQRGEACEYVLAP